MLNVAPSHTKSLPRRQFMFSAVALAAALALPRTARAEPMTALAAAAAIATIVGTIAGIASGIDTSKKLAEINARLDSIIATQEAILGELRNMRAYFDEALFANWKTINENTIQVQFYRFAARVDNPLTPGVSDELTQIIRDLENPAFSLATHFGLAAYVSFASALSLELLVYRKLRKPRQEIVNLARAYASVLRLKWLNKKDPTSIYALITATTAEISRRIVELNRRSRKFYAGSRQERDGDYCWTPHAIYVNIVGTFENGFTAQNTDEAGQKSCYRDPCHNPRVCLKAPSLEELDAQQFATAGRAADALVLPEVPPFVASGNSFLDSFLEERTNILVRRRDLVAYEFLREAMENMTTRLDGPIN